MRLRPRTIWTITGVSAAALAGLVVLQYFLLRNAFDVREQAFERNVHAALISVAQRIETGEATGKVVQLALGAPLQGDKTIFFRVETDSDHRVHPRGGTGLPDTAGMSHGAEMITEAIPFRIRNNALEYSVRTPQHITLRVFNLARKKDTLLVDSDKKPGEYEVGLSGTDFKDDEIVVKYRADSSTYTLHAVNGIFGRAIEDASVRERREQIVNRAVDNLVMMDLQPVEKRVSSSLLDSVAASALHDAGIDLPFACGIISDKDDSIRVRTRTGFDGELRSSSLVNPLFPDDILASRNRLAVFFPGGSRYILLQVWPILGLTILFMGAVAICFVITIRTIVRQKDFSLRLVEFINNMTHEFKTPISTIGVAVETITRDDVAGRPDRVYRYAEVIREENVRMKHQVDRILQMAVLEEGDYEIRTVPVDLHAVIRGAIANAALQVEAKGGKIACELAAGSPIVNADPVHAANIMHNILDNATKYSAGPPEISVRTWNGGPQVFVEISDHGIGIPPADRDKVFEKYYRVRTGNVHDVKGFGLGLSYVRLMVRAFSGDVSLSSEPGKGTTVLLRFPSTQGAAA